MSANNYYGTPPLQQAYGGAPGYPPNGAPPPPGQWDPNQQAPPPMHTQYAPQPQMGYDPNQNQQVPPQGDTDRGAGTAAACCGLGACCLCCLQCCALEACCDAVF